MPTIRCVGCQTDNEPELTGALCRNCGQVLPNQGPAALPPAVITSPDTEFRQGLIDIQEKQRFARQHVMVLLFALAVMQVVCGCSNLLMSAEGPISETRRILLAVLIAVCALSALALAGLGWWAKYKPFPAALCGLLLYSVMTILATIGNPESIVWIITVNGALVIALGQAAHASYHAFGRHPDMGE